MASAYNPYDGVGTSNTANNGYSPYGGGWYIAPQATVSYTPSTPYTPHYDANSSIGQLINQVGQYLKPQEAFSKTNPYDAFAAPQHEVFNLWEQNTFRPEQEANYLNPFRQARAGNLAAGSFGMMGSSGDRLKTQDTQAMQQYYQDPLDQARSSYEDMIRKMYEQKMSGSYNSANAFTNI